MIAQDAARPLTIALAGQPNVGKSTIFNMITGLSQHVGNWPGKTVERKEGLLNFAGRQILIVDLPGAYGLTARSEEERIARDFIIREKPDAVILVANAAALDRNLYLLAELLELHAPVALGLNMIDVAASEGIEIKTDALAAALGAPVTPITAVRNQGVADVVQSAIALADRPASFRPNRPDVARAHKRTLTKLQSLIGAKAEPYDAHWLAVKLLEGDPEVTQTALSRLPDELRRKAQQILAENESAVLDIVGARYAWVDRATKLAVAQNFIGPVGLTEKLDRWLLHPVFGMAAMLAVLSATFWLTFAIAWPLQRLLETQVVTPLRQWTAEALSGAPGPLAPFVSDGLLGGVGLVMTFAPLLVIFYAIFGFLEDTGYFPRVAYLTDRFMHRLGLHGKSFLPFCLGFGCNVPAIMGARVIESPVGRLLTILLAPLVPCSARFAVLAFLAPVFFGAHALWASLALVALNIVVLALVGVLLNNTLFKGERVAFIMELPLYHAPNLRSIGLFTWTHTSSFLRRASTIILSVATMVWALGYFPQGHLETSYLAAMGRFIEPVGHLMGLDWRLTVALLTSFVAKENAIATLGVLYKADGASLAQTLSASISTASGLAFLVTTMLFIPCAATVAAMRQETRSWSWTLFAASLLLVVATLAGAISYHAFGLFVGGVN